MPLPKSLTFGSENHVSFWVYCLTLIVATSHRHLTETNRLKHHRKFMLVVPPQPVPPELRLNQSSLFEHLEPQPKVLQLFDTVRARSLVDRDGSAVGGTYTGTTETPLLIGGKVPPGDGQRHQEFSAWLQMFPVALERCKGLRAIP